MRTDNKTEKEVLGVIAKQLKKIAKELKQANEPVYELTEKGKEAAKQLCEEKSNAPSDDELIAAARLLKNNCNNYGMGCTNAHGECKLLNNGKCKLDENSTCDWEV